MKTSNIRPANRRGVLLLLVLSCLTLFMMLGALMLVLATRARTSARAFASASSSISADAIRNRTALDEALMMLLRGGTNGIPTTSGTFESILADRYGVDPVGSSTSYPVSSISGPSVTLSSTPPGKLLGRVLTIIPDPSDFAAQTVSYRIESQASRTLTHDNRRTNVPFRTAPTIPTNARAVINGRDFEGKSPEGWASNESWDAAGQENAFITKATLSGHIIDVSRPAFGGNGQVCVVDNDADGEADGIWLTGTDNFLPSQMSDSGSEINFRVSYLVLDLDGRFNVNAHGGVTSSGTIGPGAVDGGAAFSSGVWTALTGKGMLISGSSPSPDDQQRRPPPGLGYTVDGRLGRAASTSPYDLRLDFGGPRPGSASLDGDATASGTAANLFSVGELERVLRPFDVDSSGLPPRLAAILGTAAQKSRMLVTTDSWDTTGLTGEAAEKIASVVDDSNLPQDFRKGQRFNVNSGATDPPTNPPTPMTDDQKRAFFKDLCAVVIAAGVSDEKIAQWAANVVEFRDVQNVPLSFDVPAFVAAAVPIDRDPPPPSVSSVTGNEAAEFTSLGGNATDEKFISVGQLLCVPRGSQQELSDPNRTEFEKQKLRRSLAADYPQILNCMAVKSPFTNTIKENPWREPGRVNVNTSGTAVWRETVGDAVNNPFITVKAAGEMLAHELCFNPVPAENASFMSDRDYTLVNTDRANRLANIATTRSNVFAVWITVEASDSAEASQKTYHRLFAVIDRSIPVGYLPGEDLNARDTVRLLRYLD